MSWWARTWQRNDAPLRATRRPRRRPERPPSRPASTMQVSFRVRSYGDAIVKLNGCENRIAVLVDGIRKRTLGTHTFDDVVLLRALAIVLAGRMPGFGEQFVRGYVQIVEQGIGRPQMEVLDDVHVAVVRHSNRFVHRQVRLRQERHRVDHERVFLPVPDGMAMKARVGIGRMRAAIGIDAPQPIAIALAEYRDPARREQNFEGIVSDEHPARHAGRETVIDDGEGAAGRFFRVHVIDLLRNLGRPRGPIGLLLGDLIADDRRPDSTPVRQLGKRLPVLCTRRGVDRVTVRRVGGQRREPRASDQAQGDYDAMGAFQHGHEDNRIALRLPIIRCTGPFGAPARYTKHRPVIRKARTRHLNFTLKQRWIRAWRSKSFGMVWALISSTLRSASASASSLKRV